MKYKQFQAAREEGMVRTPRVLLRTSSRLSERRHIDVMRNRRPNPKGFNQESQIEGSKGVFMNSKPSRSEVHILPLSLYYHCPSCHEQRQVIQPKMAAAHNGKAKSEEVPSYPWDTNRIGDVENRCYKPEENGKQDATGAGMRAFGPPHAA